MFKSTCPIVSRFKILHVRDDKIIRIQIDQCPDNIKVNDEIKIVSGNSLISCKILKLWNYSYQPQTYIFKGEYCYAEIGIMSSKSFDRMMEQETFSNPVQVAYNNVLNKFKDEVTRLKQNSNNKSAERIMSDVRALANKYKSMLRAEISREVNKYNSSSDRKLIGADLQNRVKEALESFDDVVKDALTSLANKPEKKKYLSYKEAFEI